MKMCDIQEQMQLEGEKRFTADYVYLDGRRRPNGFPKRPVGRGLKHGGGIGKKMKLLRPYFVKKKGRNLCLCWRHLEWDFLCEGLHQWRKTNTDKPIADSPLPSPTPAIAPTCETHAPCGRI